MDFFTWLFTSVFRPFFWFQPLFYAFHGWLATEMALWMLFHPYNPYFIPGTKIQLPFTPGIFPRGRHKLSISIANTITEILLTEADIKRQAEKLITEENLYTTLDALIDSVGGELRDISHIRRIYRHMDRILPALLKTFLSDYIRELGKQDSHQVKHFQNIVGEILKVIAAYTIISEEQAEKIAFSLLEHVITPANIRKLLIEMLTTQNIDMMETQMRAKMGGVQGLLMRLVDIKKTFYQFRNFLIDDIVDAEMLIHNIMRETQVDLRLKEGILKLSPNQLPVETVESFKLILCDHLQRMLIENREEVVHILGNIGEEATYSITASMMHIDYHAMAEKWLPGIKRDIAHFAYTYLNKELEHLLSKALPAISLNTVIVEKIDQFSAKQLEETIQRICHRELRALAILGAFLGFWLGMISNMMAYWNKL